MTYEQNVRAILECHFACVREELIDNAVKCIVDLKCEQEPRWIPVSEKLPEEREWYLAVFKEKDTGFQLIPRVADYVGYGENEWRLIDEDGLEKEYRDNLECVAWMPLPEPYKAESEG